MKIFNDKVSSRRQINIKEVKDGILVLPQNKYRVILETSAVNFELKSEAEQDSLIDNYQTFLNSLPCPIQILIRTREVDTDSYLSNFNKYQTSEAEEIYKHQLKNYESFIKKLVSGNKILTRRFYVIIPYQLAQGKNDFSFVKEQLQLNQDIIMKALEKLGMKVRQLGNLEILDIFYNFYNAKKTKSQPLTSDTFQVLFNNKYDI